MRQMLIYLLCLGKYRTIRGMMALGYTLYDREGNEITCDEDLEKLN
jgi:hypothetical protein